MINITDSNFAEFISNNRAKPILVMFTSKRCGPCKAMYPVIESLQYEKDFIIAKADIDDCQNYIREYQIKSVPTLFLIYNADIIKRSGFLGTKQQILDFIRS